MPLIVGFVELLGAFLLISKGIGGPKVTWADILKGKAGAKIKAAGSSTTTPVPIPGNPFGPVVGVPSGKASTSETGFARAFLTTIGAPLNKTNISALEDWWAAEEGSSVLVPGHGGLNNPFEVTTSGQANVPSLGNANSVGVKNYGTEQAGILAAIGYFEEYGPGVLDAFRNGESISSIEAAVRALGPNAFGSDTSLPWGLR